MSERVNSSFWLCADRFYRESGGAILGVADGRQHPSSEQPSVIRRGAAASTEKSTLKYQIIASYAPPATMPELIAFWPQGWSLSERLQGPRPVINPETQASYFSLSRSAFARFAVRRLDFSPETRMICCEATA